MGGVADLQLVAAEYGAKPRGESKAAPVGNEKGGAKAEAAKDEGSFDVKLPDAAEGKVRKNELIWQPCCVACFVSVASIAVQKRGLT